MRVPVGYMDHYPSDWIELKMALIDAMRTIHVEHKQDEAIIFLERHMSGKFLAKFGPGSYIQEKVRYKRTKEAFFQVEYNSSTNSLSKIQATFSFPLIHLLDDYRMMEKGKRPSSTPLIPRDHKSFLEDPRQIIKEPSTTRYADYSRTPKNLYGYRDDEKERHLSYSRSDELEYGKKKQSRIETP